MNASDGACPSCHAAVAPGSAFCTRCGGALPGVTVITPVVDGGQAWGGPRRRDRRAPGPPPPGAAGQPGPVGVPAAALAYADLAQDAPVTHGSAPLGPAFDGVRPASVGRRLGALALDTAAVAAVAVPVLWLTGSPVYTALAVIELAVGLVVWEARSGRTVGNALLGLRTAKEETPYAPGLARAVGRGLILGAGHVLAGLGQWLIVGASGLDRTGRGQGWHDKAAGTVVVDVRAMRVDDDAPPASAPAPHPATPSYAASTASGFVPPPPTPLPPPPAPAYVPPPPPPAHLPPPPAPAQLPPPAPAHTPPPPPDTPSSVAPSRAPAAPPPPVPSPAAPSPTAQQPVAQPPVAQPPTAVSDPPPPPPPAPVPVAFLLTLDTGATTTVRGPGVVGRKPQAPEGEPCDHVIGIDDPGRSLSRTHIRFGIDDGRFWVEDVGSGNGTALVALDGTTVRLDPHVRHPVPPGTTVRLGARTITVRPVT